MPRSFLQRACERGYARSICAAAAELEADAVQMLIRSDVEGIISVAWSLECDHHPVSVGLLTIQPGTPTTPQPTTTIEYQAHALASEYQETK